MTLATTARVRLTAEACEAQPELRDTTGTVRATGPGWVEVAWPAGVSWHKAGDVELDARAVWPMESGECR